MSSLYTLGGVRLQIRPIARNEDTPDEAPPDVMLRVHYRRPEIRSLPPVFSHSGWWSIYRSQDRYLFHIHQRVSTQEPDRLLIIGPEFREGDLYICPEGDHKIDPLAHPLDKMLLTSYLSRRQGFTVHATGIVVDGWAFLFLGGEGAGKSTLARLWSAEQDAFVLADDRVVVRLEGDQFIATGTPWYFSSPLSSLVSAPLARLYILRHGPLNRETPIPSGPELAARIYSHTHPPYWLEEALPSHLDLCAKLAMSVPCSVLDFVPDPSVIQYVRAGWHVLL